jgi:hypothetical protein
MYARIAKNIFLLTGLFNTVALSCDIRSKEFRFSRITRAAKEDRRRPFLVQKHAKMPVFIIPSSSSAMYFAVERSSTHFYIHHGRPTPRRVCCLLHGNVNYDIPSVLSVVVQRRRRNKILENNSRSLSHLFVARNASVVKCREISFRCYLSRSLRLIDAFIFLLLINSVALRRTLKGGNNTSWILHEQSNHFPD